MSLPEQDRNPEVTVLTDVAVETAWSVLLFNDEIHTFEEVSSQLMKATGCSTGKAEDLTWQVHNDGKAQVFEGDFEPCFRVKGVLSEIGLVTQILG